MCLCDDDKNSGYFIKGYLECRFREYYYIHMKKDDIENIRINYCPLCGRKLDEKEEGGNNNEQC